MLFDSDCSSSNMHGLSRDVKMLAALRDEEHSGNGRSLLDAARKMTGALSDLLNAAQPDSKEPRTALLGAATKVCLAKFLSLSPLKLKSPNYLAAYDNVQCRSPIFLR